MSNGKRPVTPPGGILPPYVPPYVPPFLRKKMPLVPIRDMSPLGRFNYGKEWGPRITRKSSDQRRKNGT